MYRNRALANGLAAQGHNVTVLSFSVESNPMRNVHYIHLERGYDALYGNGSEKNDIMARHVQNAFQAVISTYKFCRLGCIGALNSEGFQQLLNYPDNFSLLIYDFTCGPCLLGVLHRFNIKKMISVTGFNVPPFATQLVGGHKNSAYVPHYTLAYGHEMNFAQRTLNFLVHLFDSSYRKFIFLPRIEAISSKYNFNIKLSDLEKRTDLMFVNSDPAANDFVESLPPNVIYVGGLQISKPKPLPDELKTFVEAGKKGSILFAMGTNFKTAMMNNKKHMFFEAFRRLPDYNFLWKFDEMNNLEKPENVLVNSWLPQADILAHSNVIAFISHCGLLSTHEAIWYGVPLIGLPIFTDQKRNCEISRRSGIAEVMELNELSADEIVKAIKKVLTDPKYRENIKIKSNVFRKQKETPMERALWWTEFLIENSADHLKSPSQHMNFIKSNSYDVMFMLIIVAYISIRLIIWCILTIKRKFNVKIKVE